MQLIKSTSKKLSFLQPFGVNYPGSTAKLTVYDTKGNIRLISVAQLSQTADGHFPTPTFLVGLGRTNNYIEEMFVGMQRNQSLNWRKWSGIIPNAHVIIHPYQSVDKFAPNEWYLELLINPAQHIKWVLLALIVNGVILSGFVMILRHLEHKEDENEKRRVLHTINFDAL